VSTTSSCERADDRRGRWRQAVRAAVQDQRAPFAARLPPPAAGEHSDEILGEAGFSADEIAALRAQKVI
jgi:crotonobetainyl-CoA:carnitine CoA-transferase CaiB-like acyl-CoA transferase